MEDINLHFTGDFHAITTANNLLAALIDNHVYWGNELDIDVRRINWRRVIDMNDRALRSVVSSLGGAGNGFPREDGFDITVASEVMAIFCLAKDLDDLKQRLGNIIFARARGREHRPLRASQLKGEGAMTALLKDALMPNLVQTMEGNPAFVHGGPFANIAHGCNSVMATTTALKLGDYVVTEAGFGADLGAEKFFDIKCRKAGLSPAAAVIVATVRALKMHGGVALGELARENLKALEHGFANLARHISNVAKFGVPPASIPDYLALVGDSADGYPGLRGWGAKSAAAVLAKFGHIEAIPDDPREWHVNASGPATLAKTLSEERDRALLFRTLATLRTDVPVFESVDELEWKGATRAFEAFAARFDAAVRNTPKTPKKAR